jgi:hypothetical protein
MASSSADNNSATKTKKDNDDRDRDDSPKESCTQKMRRVMGNCGQATGLCCFKAKENTQIQAVRFQKTQRQKQFGVDYLNLLEQNATSAKLQTCLDKAMAEIERLQYEIDRHHTKIDRKTEKVNEQIQTTPDGGTAPAEQPWASTSTRPAATGAPKNKPKARKPTPTGPAGGTGSKASYPDPPVSPRKNVKPKPSPTKE